MDIDDLIGINNSIIYNTPSYNYIDLLAYIKTYRNFSAFDNIDLLRILNIIKNNWYFE